MKRFLTVAIVLILLMGACGTAPTEPTQSPAPEITPSAPVATDEFVKETDGSFVHIPTLADLPDYVPELGFEHESVWSAEAFGNNGAGLMYVSGEENGERRVRLYFYDCAPKTGEILTTAFDLLAHSDEGKYEFYLSQEEDALTSGFSLLSGTAELNGGKIQLSYSEAALERTQDVRLNCLETGTFLSYSDSDFTKYLPTEFVRLSEDEASKAMYKMPLFRDELRSIFNFAPTEQELSDFWEDEIELVECETDPLMYELSSSNALARVSRFADSTGSVRYHIWKYVAHTPETAVSPRMAMIGDELGDVLSAFCLGDELSIDAPDEGAVYIYGFFLNSSRLEFRDGKPAELCIAAEVYVVIYHIDEDGCVGAIEISDCSY